MRVLRTGKNKIRDIVADAISEGEWGTDDTDASEGQTELFEPVSDTKSSVQTSTSGFTFNVTHELDSSTATGETLHEFMAYFDDGTPLCRAVIPAYEHSEDKELTTIATVRIR